MMNVLSVDRVATSIPLIFILAVIGRDQKARWGHESNEEKGERIEARASIGRPLHNSLIQIRRGHGTIYKGGQGALTSQKRKER
jgi:hypothetical protein